MLLGGRGGKRSHKGQKRHFTSEDEIRAQQEKEEKERAWRVRMTGHFQGINVIFSPLIIITYPYPLFSSETTWYRK